MSVEPIRLGRRLAALLQCSRREAELYIEDGLVSVDGVCIDSPQHRVTDERVELAPGAKLEHSPPVTLLLHKPLGVDMDSAGALLRADHHASDDIAPFPLLGRHFKRQLALMPLAAQAEGLSVFTQVPGIARKLRDEAHTLEQEYIVGVSGDIDTALAQLEREPRETHARCRVSRQNETHLRVALKGNTQTIVRLFEGLDIEPTSFRRIRIGALSMGRLPSGQWRYLKQSERF
ncbi:S4 domain-containing protein [Halotalea alkalilenta]|uniref:S4 domain-containing protein n=1 Tax=Halotalea alkalilenta TaxID=376489 RepID=UPI00047F75E6|nr:S4 domain-containing protein [Halotalea alkalilenta]